MPGKKSAIGWGPHALRPVPGDGVLQRSGDVVTLVSSAGSDAAIDQLLEACRGASDGRKLARQLARMLTDDDNDEFPAFVVLAPTGDELAVFVYGDATVAVVDAAGDNAQLSGRASSTWVDRVVGAPVTSLTAYLGAASSAAADSRTNLTDGAVPAAGLVVGEVAAASPGKRAKAVKPAAKKVAAKKKAAPKPLPDEPTVISEEPPLLEPAGAPEPDFESVLLLETQPGTPATPLPVAGDEAAEHAHASGGAVIVKGIMCKRKHFNGPTAAFCGVCGISMVQQTHELVDGPRPPLGVIVLDDGTTFGLDDDYVIGREPEIDSDVVAGRARALTIRDDEGTVSRAHALVHLEGWDVQLVDRGSANGTYVAPPNTTAWTPLSPHEPMLIVPGTRVQIGRRTFVFDAHNRV
ncbi:MAG: hypothetical protein QOG53_3403 [Frankiales bacterium]|jgi:hypothetical protein|nr:hypothetical protein [Frankiales bacterium]